MYVWWRRYATLRRAIYAATDDPLTNWDVDDLIAVCSAAGLTVETQLVDEVSQVQVTPA